MIIYFQDIAPSSNQGFSCLPEDEPKSTSHKFGNQLTSSVKDVGDVYENEEHVPDISIDQIKQAIDEKSKDKNAGFNKEYSVSHKHYTCIAKADFFKKDLSYTLIFNRTKVSKDLFKNWIIFFLIDRVS